MKSAYGIRRLKIRTIMKTINGRLKKYKENVYKVIHKRPFEKIGEILIEDVNTSVNFAYEMAYGEGKHRVTRSGGSKKRTASEIFIDTFQGKIAEYGMYRYLQNNGIEVTPPDLAVEGYGVWDAFDLEYKNWRIAVKSTKFYGELLLLETQDWNEKGEYIPNIKSGNGTYDFIVLLRLFPDVIAEIKDILILYETTKNKEMLFTEINSIEWAYDIAGYITNKDLIRIIQKEYILPKNALLNGSMQMDAENYYVQAGDMRWGNELPLHLKKYEYTLKNVKKHL